MTTVTLSQEDAQRVLACIKDSAGYKVGNPAYEQAEASLTAALAQPAPARELSDEEKAIIRRALGDHGSFCYARANAIAQDKTGKTKVEWVGLAQDEGKTAYALMSDPLFAHAVLAASK